MTKARIFMNNRSQAVRIPKALALDSAVKEVELFKAGRGILLIPVEETWSSWFDSPGASADFMCAREQPDNQERDSL